MAKSLTIKNKNNQILYPKTVSSLVYDNSTGNTVKQDLDSLIGQVAELQGVENAFFGGIVETSSDIVSDYSTNNYSGVYLYMMGTDMTSLVAYQYTGSGSPMQLFGGATYDFTDYSEVKQEVDELIFSNGYELLLSTNVRFSNTSLAYSSESLNLEVGKTYRITLQTSSFDSGKIAFYLRKVAANNTPNIKVTDDATGEQVMFEPGILSKDFLFTPTTAEYQFIAAWHNNTDRLTQNVEVKVYDITKVNNIEVLEDKVETLEESIFADNEELSFSHIPQQLKVITNGNWVNSNSGYYSRMIQTKEGSYLIVASNTKPAYVAVFSTKPVQTNGTVANPDASYQIEKGFSKTIQCTEGQWMFIRDDSSSNTYVLPTVYFTGTRIDKLGRRIEDLSYSKQESSSTLISGFGIIADNTNSNFGGTLSTSSAYSYTDYIDISGAVKLDIKTIWCGSDYTGQSIVGAVLYDSNKNPLYDYGFYAARAVNAGNVTYTIVPPSNAKYIRTTIWSDDSSAAVSAYYPLGIQITNSIPAVITRNQREIEAIYAAKKMSHSTFSYNLPNHVLNFCVAHITDIHCDTLRYKNFREFIDNVEGINAAVMTGDIVIDPTSTQFASITGVSGEKEVLMCVGNHDKGAASSGTVPTNESIYTLMGMNTNTGKLYYYKDYTATEPVKNGVVYKIRMIFLNQYDIDGVTGSLINNYTTYSQEQIDWLISTLQDAKTNGYAVMVCLHTQDRNMGCAVNTKKFYDRVYDASGKAGAGPDPIIEDIVNAFKTGGTLTKDYTWDNISRTVSVNASFSGAGTFIAYLSGHLHRDCIAYSANYPDQLYLGGNCGCCYARGYANRPYGTEMSALPRVEGEKSEDCFNVYGINMEAHLICVVRIGATINDRMENIDYDVYEF